MRQSLDVYLVSVGYRLDLHRVSIDPLEAPSNGAWGHAGGHAGQQRSKIDAFGDHQLGAECEDDLRSLIKKLRHDLALAACSLD